MLPSGCGPTLFARRDGSALPSLHIVGTADAIVSNRDSRAPAVHFASPVIVEHDGGHVVPRDARLIERVRTFLRERRAGERPTDAGKMQAMTAAPIDVPLWNDGAAPTVMRVVFPERAPEKRVPALLVFRGGAYAINHGSGGGAAEWAAQHGMVGIEVAYRCQETGDAFPKGYADAARAVRIARARADAWGIDPARVGLLGFSAGGHLASLVSTQPKLYVDPADDLAPRIDAKPDFVVLGYPVISFVEGYRPGGYVGTATNFFGRSDADEAERRRFSNELHVAPEHPPAFVWTTEDDALVSASHSRLFSEACERAGVPASLIVFAHGPHAMGLALDATSDVRTWTGRLLEWLAGHHIL